MTVTRVVDGDTIYISPPIDGLTDVRLIGVDTPETHKPGTPVQPYGPQASAFTTRMLQGKKVALETDVEKVDLYGRLLAYVWTSPSTMFNEVLLRQGYAQLATFPPNVKYVDRFREDQAEARAARRGLWGLLPSELCQETDRGNGIGGGCSTTPATSSPPAPQSPASSEAAGSASGGVPPATKYDCPPGYPVKANQSGIYHVPGGAYYDETTPVRCYATPQDAVAYQWDGWTASHEGEEETERVRWLAERPEWVSRADRRPNSEREEVEP